MAVAKTYPDKKVVIPRSVALFLIKALILFIVWKVAYLYVIMPKRILDDPLTHSVGMATKDLLNFFSSSPHYTAIKTIEDVHGDKGVLSFSVVYIYRDGKMALSIGDPCNALEVMVLYAGFIICFPSTLKRKLFYIPVGLILIYGLNIIRCAALVLIAIYYNSYLDFSHHFLFTFIVYAFIFLLWYFFTKNRKTNERVS